MSGIDLRPTDIELLDEMDAGGFSRLWSDELCRVKSDDWNQERWHLARMAYLAGRLMERDYEICEVVDIIRDHRSLHTDKAEKSL